ncbi:uncharacterized protein LOC107867599 isoform X1 [Capsicum annuum]|uniref:uncharacterized protein LOC107867599 isoform X1 n=1 Tax=Capsicum annuum TaxID=4072 RepID=UPI001FB0C7B3|nr:uncharacterized protein LOC107867599 isoform X1 [Capsicum annuum]
MFIKFRGTHTSIFYSNAFPSYCFTSQCRLYSSSTSSHSLVNYLVDSLGFSKQEATTASSKKTQRIKDLLHRVENDFRVPRDSSMFHHAFQVLSAQTKYKLDRKIEIFKSFGWSDDDVLEMFRKLPHCIGISEVRIQEKLNLFMKELGFVPAFLASHPAILAYSLEKRVIPRMQVLKSLDERKLERRMWSFYTVLVLAETKFMEYFVLPYKDQIPDLYEPLKINVAP